MPLLVKNMAHTKGGLGLLVGVCCVVEQPLPKCKGKLGLEFAERKKVRCRATETSNVPKKRKRVHSSSLGGGKPAPPVVVKIVDPYEEAVFTERKEKLLPGEQLLHGLCSRLRGQLRRKRRRERGPRGRAAPGPPLRFVVYCSLFICILSFLISLSVMTMRSLFHYH